MEIFVGNLPFETSQEDLSATFGKFGEVANIKMLTDRDTGNFRGIAFITMNDIAAANKAIKELNGTDMGGRAMRVDVSQPRENRPNNRFGGGRPSFGGNRGFGGGNSRGGYRR